MRPLTPLTFAVAALLSLACTTQRGTIGALLAQRDDHTLVVREVPEGLAAAKAGLEPGDELLLIDGRDVRAMTPAAVHRVLSGEVGQPVKLTLVRGDRVLRVTVVRTPAEPEKPVKSPG
ncbi:MAG TPA: PDZ domain-containing protein [Polyangiaceae bacterium]|nr:PDZ domain-containing protein [Polyangiaceae bacterium]